MARRKKALGFGSRKDIPGHLHREHRSKKGRKKPIPHYGKIIWYREKLRQLYEAELNNEIKNANSSSEN